jgi:LmbE family N-acetylglucosaminyl deacetylase
MNILVVAAHPDDELLGCGATIRRLADAGHDVYSVILCANADARFDRPATDTLHQTAAAASRAIGIKESVGHDFKNIQFNIYPHLEMVRKVEQAILRFKPNWVFTHHGGDLNIDHRVCHEVTMAAVMLPQRMSSDLSATMIERVYLFEILSSTDWAPPTAPAFQPNSFFDVKATLEGKITALENFEGALKPFPHSRSAENLLNLARLRGAQVGIDAAEAFMLVRDVNV